VWYTAVPVSIPDCGVQPREVFVNQDQLSRKSAQRRAARLIEPKLKVPAASSPRVTIGSRNHGALAESLGVTKHCGTVEEQLSALAQDLTQRTEEYRSRITRIRAHYEATEKALTGSGISMPLVPKTPDGANAVWLSRDDQSIRLCIQFVPRESRAMATVPWQNAPLYAIIDAAETLPKLLYYANIEAALRVAKIEQAGVFAIDSEQGGA
jgi:hypothetical protein